MGIQVSCEIIQLRVWSFFALNRFEREKYENAYLGNLTKRQYNLIKQYYEAENKWEFRKKYPEILDNPRVEYIKHRHKENAILALWGLSDIYSVEAFNEEGLSPCLVYYSVPVEVYLYLQFMPSG